MREKAGVEGGSYTVTFITNGGTPNPGTHEYKRGEKIIEPDEVIIYDVPLDGWYREASFKNKWNFNKDTVTGDITLYAKWNFSLPLTDVKYVEPYLAYMKGGNDSTNPVFLPVALASGLGYMHVLNYGWQQLLSAIHSADKFVDLDLSGCPMDGSEFNPHHPFEEGKNKIISLKLPDATEKIRAGTFINSNFQHFFNLKTVSGANVTHIGEFTFTACWNLTGIDFKKVTDIGESAFSSCQNLVSMSLPVVENIGSNAFYNCKKLTDVSFSDIIKIDRGAFHSCSGLKSVGLPKSVVLDGNPFCHCPALKTFILTGNDGNLSLFPGDNALIRNGNELASFPSASGVIDLGYNIEIIGDEAFFGATNITKFESARVVEIGMYAFLDCSGLTTVILPNVEIIGNQAFGSCTSLGSLSLPKVEIIEAHTFVDCTNLYEVNIPAVTQINRYAFSFTGDKQLSITMGAVAPTVYDEIFFFIKDEKDVTVKVPSSPEPEGYGEFDTYTKTITVSGDNADHNWANGFRGGGWTIYSTSLISASAINSKINLVIEQQ